MLILFCCDPTQTTCVNPAYAGELRAARAAGHDAALINLEALSAGDLSSALDQVPRWNVVQDAVLRAGILPADAYDRLHLALLLRGVQLVNDLANALVSPLPAHINPREFYENLPTRLPHVLKSRSASEG